MRAVPGFSFFYQDLDEVYKRDEKGLVEIDEVAKTHFICWNDGTDGPVLAGPSGEPVFSVIGPKHVFGRSLRPANVAEFERIPLTNGTVQVRYGSVCWNWNPKEDSDACIASGSTEPNWAQEAWFVMTEVATKVARGDKVW